MYEGDYWETWDLENDDDEFWRHKIIIDYLVSIDWLAPRVGLVDESIRWPWEAYDEVAGPTTDHQADASRPAQPPITRPTPAVRPTLPNSPIPPTLLILPSLPTPHMGDPQIT